MVTTFNKKDLIDFGKYLLSEERENRLKQTDIDNPKSVPYEERRIWVHDADFQNWKESNVVPSEAIIRDCTYPEALQAIKEGYWAIRKYAYGRFVISKYPDKLVMTELDYSIHHNYIPSFEDQLAEDWIIITDPYFFKKRGADSVGRKSSKRCYTV